MFFADNHLCLFNPAVTLAIALIGGVTWARSGLIFISQVLGSMAAAGVVQALFPGPMAVSTTLNDSTSVARGLCTSMLPYVTYIRTAC